MIKRAGACCAKLNFENGCKQRKTKKRDFLDAGARRGISPLLLHHPQLHDLTEWRNGAHFKRHARKGPARLPRIKGSSRCTRYDHDDPSIVQH